MDKLVLCTFLYIIFLLLLSSTQSHGSDFTDSASLTTEKETAEPMLNIISELANLFIDIEEAFNKRSVPKADFEEYSDEQMNENHRQSSGYFNRIQQNSRNLQERIGFAVIERPSDLLESSDVPGKEMLTDKTSVSSSTDQTSAKPEANSASGESEATLQVTDTDIEVQKDDKTKDEAQKLLLKHVPDKDDLGIRIERLSQLYERIQQIRNSLIHMKSKEMSQTCSTGSEIVASEITANEPQDILDGLTSESEMDRPMEKFLRRSASNLTDPHADKTLTTDEKNSKLSYDGTKVTKPFRKQVPKANLKLVFESYSPLDSDIQLHYEKKDFIPELIYYPVYKLQDDVSSDEDIDVKEASESEKTDNSLELKVSSDKDILLMPKPVNSLTFRVPLHIQKSTAKPLLAFYHRSGSTELPTTSDKPEIKLLLPAFFYPDKYTEAGKTRDEPDIILAFASNGMPLKLGISEDVKNPITYLNDILRESDVALNVPVELHEDGEAEPVGEDVLEVGIGDGGVVARPRYFDLSNNDDLEGLLRTLKELKNSQSSRNKQEDK